MGLILNVVSKGENSFFREYLVLALIFTVAFYIRVSAFLEDTNSVFGQRDAAYHYQMGKLVYDGEIYGYVRNQIIYGLFQGVSHVFFLNHYLSGFLSWFTGDFQHTVFITNAFFSSLSVLTVYILTTHLLGRNSGFAAASITAVSLRDVMSLNWGQWPAAYVLPIIPLTLYLFIKSIADKKYLPHYFLTQGLCFLAHPQMAFIPLSICTTYYLLWERKKIRLHDIQLPILVFIIITLPIAFKIPQLINIVDSEEKAHSISETLSWYPLDKNNLNYPPSWYDPIMNYGEIPVVASLMGAYLLLKNRKNKQYKTSARLFFLSLILYFLLLHATPFIASVTKALRFILFETYLVAFFASVIFSGDRKSVV